MQNNNNNKKKSWKVKDEGGSNGMFDLYYIFNLCDLS